VTIVYNSVISVPDSEKNDLIVIIIIIIVTKNNIIIYRR